MLEDILSIAGEQGLFKLITQGKNNIIVESLKTGKKKPAFSTSKISKLNDVAIYTENDEVLLKEVFVKIFDKYDNEIPVTNKASSEELVEFMSDILPNYDKERVYLSDIKKVVNWYHQLIEHNIINADSIEKEKEAKEKDENAEKDIVENKDSDKEESKSSEKNQE